LTTTHRWACWFLLRSRQAICVCIADSNGISQGGANRCSCLVVQVYHPSHPPFVHAPPRYYIGIMCAFNLTVSTDPPRWSLSEWLIYMNRRRVFHGPALFTTCWLVRCLQTMCSSPARSLIQNGTSYHSHHATCSHNTKLSAANGPLGRRSRSKSRLSLSVQTCYG